MPSASNISKYKKQRFINAPLSAETLGNRQKSAVQSPLNGQLELIENMNGTSDLANLFDYKLRMDTLSKICSGDFERSIGAGIGLGMSLIDAMIHLSEKQTNALTLGEISCAEENRLLFKKSAVEKTRILSRVVYRRLAKHA